MRSYAYTADGRLAFASISGMPDAAYAYEPGTGNLIGIKRGSEPTATLAYEQGSGRIAALLSQGATQTVFSFDSRGRRASQGTPASPQAVRFTYDDADRLVGYSDASRGVSASYAYDAYGQRVRSVVASGSLVTTTTYAYDGLSLLYATTVRSDGTTESVAYLYDAAGAPVAGIYEGSAAAAPVAFFIATTARGDVAELLDASGAPFALYSYDAYGNPGQVRTAATARISAPLAAAVARANALRYAGYAYDAHSGLCCLSKRYYDPATAQFLTKDPAKADGEESPYQYCGGDPVGKVDPSGEWAVRTIWSAWVPLWKVGSWLYRQAVYAAVSAWASSAAASAVWARASSRVIGNATAKMAARIAKWAVKGLSKLFAVDPMLARVTDLVAKLQWSVRRPTLAVWVYHHAGYAATFCRATLIETRRLFTERFGYVTRASVTRRLFTDAQAREVAKDCLYLSS